MFEKRRRGRGRFIPLNEALGRSLARGPLNFMAQKLRVFEVWPRVTGPEAAAKSKIDLIDGARLIVLVPGPAWLDRFRYHKAEWLRRLNAELAGAAEIEDIIFKVGEF